jgi:hypothetical protein
MNPLLEISPYLAGKTKKPAGDGRLIASIITFRPSPVRDPGGIKLPIRIKDSLSRQYCF